MWCVFDRVLRNTCFFFAFFLPAFFLPFFFLPFCGRAHRLPPGLPGASRLRRDAVAHAVGHDVR